MLCRIKDVEDFHENNGNLTMSILLQAIKLQSLLEVVTLNDIACKPANTEIGQGDVIIE